MHDLSLIVFTVAWKAPNIPNHRLDRISDASCLSHWLHPNATREPWAYFLPWPCAGVCAERCYPELKSTAVFTARRAR